MTITNWPISERPREKLLLHGSKCLTDAELLAILLQNGTRGKTVMDIAQELLRETGSLKALFSVNAAFFRQKPGLGNAKFALMKAAFELGRRYYEEPLPEGKSLGSPEITQRAVSDRLKGYSHEVFACLYLDNQLKILGFEEVFHGTLGESSIYPREIIKRCFTYNAGKIILAHNHPSGDSTPSLADKEITLILKDILEAIDIQLLDHIIVGKKCFSFAEAGLL